MKALFYKGVRPGIAGVYSLAVRAWTRTPFSHCELLFSDGTAASSSYADDGVRFVENFRQHLDNPKDWVVVELPAYLEDRARQWFVDHEGEGYDVWGNIHFILSPIGGDHDKWFCSEAVAAALGIQDPDRFNPGDLYEIITLIVALQQPQVYCPVAT